MTEIEAERPAMPGGARAERYLRDAARLEAEATHMMEMAAELRKKASLAERGA